jgi:hypothetical protein
VIKRGLNYIKFEHLFYVAVKKKAFLIPVIARSGTIAVSKLPLDGISIK